MKKLKKMPKFAKEIIITVISFVVLCLLWAFFIEEYIVLSDQGLSTIGLALTTSLGVLTAIVVSFVLILWQRSHQERSTSYWRWRNTLIQLANYFDANLEVLMEIAEDTIRLIQASAEVALVAPMPRNRFIKLSNEVLKKATKVGEELQGIKRPSKEEVAKGRACKDITMYIVDLTAANFEHRLSHYLYLQIIRLRGLLYQLLAVLAASVLVVAIGVTMTSIEISDVINAPLAAILIAWVFYVLIQLGREIKRVSFLEDEFRKQEEKHGDKAV